MRQLLVIAKRRWGYLAMALMLGVAVASAYYVVTPPKYESTAVMLVMKKDSRLAARGVDGGGEASEVRVTEELMATHMQMLQSRSMVDGALADSGLTELPSIVDHLNVGRNQKRGDYVIENLRVSRGGTGQARTAHVLNVSYKNHSDVDAEAVLTALVKRYQAFLAAKFQDVNQEAASLIEQAQNELADELEAAERAYEQFRQQSPNLMWRKVGEEATNIHRVRHDSIMQEITNLQLSRAEESARLDALTETLNGRSVEELSDLERLSMVDEKNLTRVGLLLMAQKAESESPAFLAEQPIRMAAATANFDSLAVLKSRESSMLTDLGPEHPDVINTRKQIESFAEFLDKQKQDLTSGVLKTSVNSAALFTAYHRLLENDVLALLRREERLQGLAEETMTLASEMVKDEIQGESLRREVQRKQVLFDAAVDRLRDINLAKDYGGFINEVLAKPETGLQVSPKKSIAAAIGLFIAMFFGVCGVAIAEYRDRRFRTIEDLQNTLQLSVLGRVPFVPVKSSRRLFGGRKGLDPARTPRLLDSDSPGADAFRIMRSLTLFTEGEEFRQVLCVTSPNPADGKSTTTGNLSISLGQLGRRVLVIDCDLRRPSQHELFGAPNETGLTTVLKGNLDPEDLILSTSFKNVFLLPRGEAVTNPAEFLATGEFARLVDTLREKFDHILLDCPPILPVVDALSTAAIADGVIVVIRVERTTQLQAQAACSSLRRAGAEVDGVVVNGLMPGSLGDDTYGYGYGYGYEQEYAQYRNQVTSEFASAATKLSSRQSGGSPFQRNSSTP
ncbi:polysaccharide biosynthesis tyrosine autokinase [Schlesneria paludicola]|uniref:polysaccharide biosynthesis tyrosine autokinase n=1 Tax=Schlesneria paludicola TaxID=360056 RepID=UPI00138B1053|nr:polysaccharide biosynthesis tyrosine autokinase [Schlesneria paludicola]